METTLFRSLLFWRWVDVLNPSMNFCSNPICHLIVTNNVNNPAGECDQKRTYNSIDILFLLITCSQQVLSCRLILNVTPFNLLCSSKLYSISLLFMSLSCNLSFSEWLSKTLPHSELSMFLQVCCVVLTLVAVTSKDLVYIVNGVNCHSIHSIILITNSRNWLGKRKENRSQEVTISIMTQNFQSQTYFSSSAK